NIAQFSTMLDDDAEIHTPYGATEAVPIISIKSKEILNETRRLSDKGFGTCIGRPINDIDIRIIKISDEPIELWSDNLLASPGDVGEITVRGDLVSRQYFENHAANRLGKIKAGGDIIHRMGDVGWMDQKGRIWFCGRKSHRVVTAGGTLFSIPCESFFNNHPRVFRSALVGVGAPGRQEPVMCIELHKPDDGQNRADLENELLKIATANELIQSIKTVLFHKNFPVDIRHNSKIFREKLAPWAEKKLK
ncbi:MAG: AMP-binding protein, partial [Deltaproteobacteria bacterium]|nr:AMP-binding protein [Deltaproteobacteria bacterium]